MWEIWILPFKKFCLQTSENRTKETFQTPWGTVVICVVPALPAGAWCGPLQEGTLWLLFLWRSISFGLPRWREERGNSLSLGRRIEITGALGEHSGYQQALLWTINGPIFHTQPCWTEWPNKPIGFFNQQLERSHQTALRD